MISRKTVGQFLIALLLTAQVGTSLHAAEHGHGDHDHEGVECVFVAVTSDDDDALLPIATSPATFITASDEKPIAIGIVNARSNLRVPPATGPPVSA